jgi:hypothetical protein
MICNLWVMQEPCGKHKKLLRRGLEKALSSDNAKSCNLARQIWAAISEDVLNETPK